MATQAPVAHMRHASVQASAQQTPSTQNPVTHSQAVPQAVPTVRSATQEPVGEQWVAGLQAMSQVPLQEVTQAVAPLH